MLCEIQLILRPYCWPSNLHTHPAKPHTAKPRNVTLQTIREVCVCVTSIHMCLWHGKVGKKKKSVEWGITTLVCESQRALSLICNQNLVSRPGSVSSLTSSSTAMSRPWQWCLVGFFVQRIDSPARKYSNQGWWLLAYWLTVCTESPREAEWADVL